jgi:DnaK suppressor protein
MAKKAPAKKAKAAPAAKASKKNSPAPALKAVAKKPQQLAAQKSPKSKPAAKLKTTKPAAKKEKEKVVAKPAAKKPDEAKAKETVKSKVVAAEKPKGKVDVKEGKSEKKQTLTGATPPPKIQPKLIESVEIIPVARREGVELFTKQELETFRSQLSVERNKILDKARQAMESGNIQIDKNEMYDEVDQASAMVEQNLTFRLLDRDRKLLGEIEHALHKIDSGDFGYCEGTGEAIPKRRLELRPWCRHSVKYQERLEKMRKAGRGVGDEDEL